MANRNEQAGYWNAQNPGPLIEAKSFNERTLRPLIVHEAVHHWCGVSEKTLLQNWEEEGLADLLAHERSGWVPQLAITEVFQDPCKGSLYGSSFLWSLAKQLKGAVLNNLAALYLGLRLDLLHGSVNLDARCHPESSELPRGWVSKEPVNNMPALPFWKSPWGEIFLSGERDPNAQFVWSGPL